MGTRILVAEDEPLMRERLLELLSGVWPEAEVAAVAHNGNDAWDNFLEFEPDVAFLDIRMPGLSGLEVALRIGTAAHIVFVSAYDQYAVDAFEAGALDYLLKPVEADRLTKTVERIQSKLSSPPHAMQDILLQLKASLPEAPRETLKWIKASVGKHIKLIDIDDVIFFQSDTKYTRIVLRDSEALVRTPLKDLLVGLDSARFWQIHRSTVVAVKSIQDAERVDAERMLVSLKGRTEKLAVSRAFTHLFRE